MKFDTNIHRQLHQPSIFFSQNKPATSAFPQNKSAPAISHQPSEQAQLDGNHVIHHSLKLLTLENDTCSIIGLGKVLPFGVYLDRSLF
jgi:hypothetical protein